MRIPRCATLALLMGLSLPPSIRGADDVVRLCADEWMPFNGQAEEERPGYVIELARAIYATEGVAVEYTLLPWDEALGAVREGRMTAAIGANKAEAEGMLLPEEPIGAPPICLMTRADSTWSYGNITSFRTARLGVIKDYSYWPNLDSYIEQNAGGAVSVTEGDAPLGELMQLLGDKKVDVIAESEPVLLWHFRANNIDRGLYRVVYKHEAEPIYLAFAPHDDGRRFAAIFDRRVKELRATGELEKLLRRYGLRDWQ